MAATRNVLGPLTTVFTPNPTCATPVAGGCDNTSCSGWKAQTCARLSKVLNSYSVIDASSCWPPTTIGAASVDIAMANGLKGWGLYSPGISCPAGHRIACRQTAGGSDDGGDDFPFQFSLMAGETAAGCCPYSYSCSLDVRNRMQTCVRTETTGTYTLVNCGGTMDPGTTITLQTVTGGIYQVIEAPMIQMNWKASDLPPTATPGSTSQSAQPTGNVSADSPKESGLSSGAQAGIGVGAALAGCFLLGGVICYMLLRRRRREKGDMTRGGSAAPQGKRQQLDSQNIYEFDGIRQAPVLPHELPVQRPQGSYIYTTGT